MNNDLISREDLKEHKFVGNKYVQIVGRTYGKTLENINNAYQKGWNDCIDAIIDNAPTVPLPDFKEGYKQAILDGKTNFSRPQGKWTNIDEYNPYYALLRCSCCGDATKEDKYEGDYWSPNYCPWCGADMQGEEE